MKELLIAFLIGFAIGVAPGVPIYVAGIVRWRSLTWWRTP
jgi:hypothetical protein